MPEVRSVRIGKYMEIEIEGENDELESRLHQLCRDLLSNPVIEDYELLKRDEPELGGRSSATPNEGAQSSRAARAHAARQTTTRPEMKSREL
jgi:hypothetical protein